MTLRDVRKDLGLTQVELAGLAGMSQGDLSRLERRTDHLLSTLQRYVQALGGQLEVAAIFGSRRYPLELGTQEVAATPGLDVDLAPANDAVPLALVPDPES